MKTFNFNSMFLNHLSNDEKKLFVNGIDQSLFLIDYTPLFSFVLNDDMDKIRHYIIYGHDLNKYSLKGLNILHLIIILLFSDYYKYIKYFEYFLKIGASPNLKTFIFIKKKLYILNCIEFFEYILQNKNIDIFKLNLTFKMLSNDEIFNIYLLLYIYETDIYLINCEKCHYFKINEIDQHLLNNNDSLNLYIHLYWKIFIDKTSLYDRNLILSKYFDKIKYPRNYPLNNGIYINQLLNDENNQICSYEFYEYKGKINYYFHFELLNNIILTKLNPLNNQEIDLYEIINILDYLEKFGNFKFNVDRHLNFPFLFKNDIKTKNLIKDKLIYIHDFIKNVNPYTNILLLKNLNKHEISYISLNLKNNNGININQTNELNNLLDEIIFEFQNNYNIIYTISHYFEESYNEILFYNKLKELFQYKNIAFIADFYEAILILEVFELLSEKIGYFNIHEFIFIWEKILILYSLEFNVSENSFPLLLMS
jgi:hypothetical protein